MLLNGWMRKSGKLVVMSICLNHIKETANSGTTITHFIQYPSVSEIHESGTNLVQKKSKVMLQNRVKNDWKGTLPGGQVGKNVC